MSQIHVLLGSFTERVDKAFSKWLYNNYDMTEFQYNRLCLIIHNGYRDESSSGVGYGNAMTGLESRGWVKREKGASKGHTRFVLARPSDDVNAIAEAWDHDFSDLLIHWGLTHTEIETLRSMLDRIKRSDT